MADFYIAQGDRLASISIPCTLSDGTVLDLTDAEDLVFRFRLADRSRPGRSGTPVVVGEATDGVLRYDWEVGDTDVPGLYLGRWTVTDADGKEFSFPNNGYTTIEVSRDP